MNDADRCTFYAIVTCFLIALRFDSPLALSIAIGLSAGGWLINIIFIYAEFKRRMK